LTSQAFRVAFLKQKYGEASPEYQQAYERAGEVIQGLRMLTLVTGVPGYLVRGVALGHGVSYEERGGAGTRDLWGQGVGEFSHVRYRGGPSHHNYDQVFRGLGIYYVIAADEKQKDEIRGIVSDMSDWAHLKHDMLVMHTDGKRVSTVLIGGWRGLGGSDRPSGGSIMALTGLKIAHHIVGNPRTRSLYDEWVDRLGLLDPARNQASIMGGPRENYDDTDHLLGDLYLLNLIEERPELRAYYQKCVRDSWEAHKDEKLAWFNYIYRAVLGDGYGDPEGSLWNLQTHPVSRVFQPQLNSIRTDIKFHVAGRGGMEALEPLPLYERASDNEYLWKGSPFRLDGWLAQTVTVLEVSPHDPYVQFAADANGHAYWSNTQGEVWHDMPGLPRVHDFLFSPAYPWMAFAATDAGIYRTSDGGQSWNRTLDQQATCLQLDPENVHVLYAVGKQGAYKSADFGEQGMGTQWQNLASDILAGGHVAIDAREKPVKLYMLDRHGMYWKHAGDDAWTAFPQTVRSEGFGDIDTIGGTPLWLRVDSQVKGRLFRAVETSGRRAPGVQIAVSDDGGQSWSPVYRAARPSADRSPDNVQPRSARREQRQEAFRRAREFQIKDLRVDSRDTNTWYGLLDDAVAVTHDAGTTWTKSSQGLDIPRVNAIWAPRHANIVIAGTPAGMYQSTDRGESWTDAVLVPQGAGAIRSEIGGAGYLTAYWMGRYHDFISEEDSHAEWWKE
jgi:photosystem II stability/assembly factor-like uncharacterized protein